MIVCPEYALRYRMEAVEHIGSGIKRSRSLCREYNMADPCLEVSDHWFTVSFPRAGEQKNKTTTITGPERQPGTKLGLSRDQVEVMRNCVNVSAIGELTAVLGRTNRTKFRDRVLTPLLNAGLVEMTIPDKPRSSKQQYQLTLLGRQILTQQDQEQT